MQIVIDIPGWLYNAIMECKEPHYSKSLGEAVRDGTPLPEHATNGDVIKALFSNGKYAECKNVIALHTIFFGVTCFDKEWWNAPYTPNKMSDAEFYRKANEKFRDTIDIKKEGDVE